MLQKASFHAIKVVLVYGFQAQDFKRPCESFWNLKIYIADYRKRYMRVFRFFGTQNKMPLNMLSFKIFRFLKGHYSKPPKIDHPIFSFFWTFSLIFSYKQLFQYKSAQKHFILSPKTGEKKFTKIDKGVLNHDFWGYFARNGKKLFLTSKKTSVCINIQKKIEFFCHFEHFNSTSKCQKIKFLLKIAIFCFWSLFQTPVSMERAGILKKNSQETFYP